MIGSKISKRYAKALLSIGREDGNYEEYGKNLREFADFCTSSPEFYRVISSRIYSGEERGGVLDWALEKSGFAPVVKNFLRLLLEKNRIGAIAEIADYYEKLTDEIANIARAEIITARPIKEDTLGRVKQALTGLTSQDVKVQIREDASLIGGIIVKIGDLVLDGSVRAQLEGLKESLKRGEYT
ncbi:MAG: ATP synthase F1 subunit delta [Deltaproteobacteria bacterium]|nr:ATP synthase F1 subunit delta [Deltaproteobacteria bacterium]MBW1922223.1 ATP synthase F1 subunit delta [Deltaproteobacteria bacterium]MBW1948633.1 ATP synthase F1 subunit delta [Deltaproteobacteria bacterium]MBW2007804.1 ATP synthase F1 subunit delta [Deltaproteobacteria bacterium]MBW2101077.1 ATP synthase F1 subunit delta [Deltaproteobacteria bacterium]